jgi:hypothetical protein
LFNIETQAEPTPRLTSVAMDPSTLSPQDQQLLQELAAMAPPSQANFTPPALLDPHYVPPSQGGVIIGVSVATTALAVIAVCLRIFARATGKKLGLGSDDYTIVLALVSL